MDYPKSTPGVGLVAGRFVDENPTTGQPGSLIPAAWANALMAELLAVIQAAGMAPNEADNAQLLRAIQAMAVSDYKKSVRCATTGPIALSGLQTIDGVALAAGDRVLVKDQAAASQNWIYVASTNAWVRAQDANESVECAPGHLVPVQAGTLNKLTVWQLTNTVAPVIGTTALTFRAVIGKNGTTLADYGIGDAYTKAQTYSQAQVDALLKNVNAMPVGSILPMPKAAVPAGFLELDGGEYSIAAYPDLAAYLGGAYNKGNEQAGFFRLPDTRGQFLRGWDHGLGVDEGREIGSSQLDAFQGFTPAGSVAYSRNDARFKDQRGVPFYNGAGGTTPQFSLDWDATVAAVDSWSLTGGFIVSDEVHGTPRVASETRPRNLAVMWCIKAWNAPVNQSNIDVAALQPLARQATETALGVLAIASQAKVNEGLDQAAAITAKTLKGHLSGFLSGPLTITPGAQTIVTHNLGYMPSLGSEEWYFENVSAEAGWSPGEIVSTGCWKATTATTNLTNGAYVYGATLTQITVGMGNGGAWQLPSKTGGVATTITLANWRLRVRIKP